MEVGRSALETLGAAREGTGDSVGRLGSESTRPYGDCQEHAPILSTVYRTEAGKGLTISVYAGYRDVRFVPPYVYIYRKYIRCVRQLTPLIPRGGDNKPTENFVSGGGFRRGS